MFDIQKFGRFLSRLRKHADLTQSELADRLNVTRQAVSKYELGDSFPDISILLKISEIFGMTLDELIGGGDPSGGEMHIFRYAATGETPAEGNFSDIVNLAPFLKPRVLSALAENLAAEGIDLSDVVRLSEYLNDTDTVRLLEKASLDSLSPELLARLIPLLDTASKNAILQKILDGRMDWHLLSALLPHAQYLQSQIEAAVIEGAIPWEALTLLRDEALARKRHFTQDRFRLVNERLARILGRPILPYTVDIYEEESRFWHAVFNDASYAPDYMRVRLDRQKRHIDTCDTENINLYILFLVNGPFDGAHEEFLSLLRCWAKFGFAPSENIKADSWHFPAILWADDHTHSAEKAKLAAMLCEKHGWKKLLEWNNSIDLIYYYPHIFGAPCPSCGKAWDLSSYEAILKGAKAPDEQTRLALFIDDSYRAGSHLNCFYADDVRCLAAIEYKEHVLGFVRITADGIQSFVADYRAWERRRAEGYARNNPFDEQNFVERVLSLTASKKPRILELGVGSGRIAAPFVKAGIDYVGVDISDAMLDECRTRMGTYENLQLLNHNIFTPLPFADNSFDIVLESRVVGADRYPFVMSEIKRVLKPGGVAVLDMGDNSEMISELSRRLGQLWSIYKTAYFDSHNITDRPATQQKRYDLSLSHQAMPTCPASDFVIPQPRAIFDRENPFSICDYSQNILEYLEDNIHHMAFFRTESMYEPCGTHFFRAMKETARRIFPDPICQGRRITTCKIYRF